MNNEARLSDSEAKDIRIPISGLVDRAIVALVGALLGFGGSTAYQKLDPTARADPFTAHDGKELTQKVETNYRANKELVDKNNSRLLIIEDHMLDCVDYRREDMKAMAEMWKQVWKLQNELDHLKKMR